MIRIPEELIEKISALVRAGYPSEICGILAGRRDIEIKTVEEFHPLANLASSPDRFELDPKEVERLDKETRERGLEIIGIYHSHPDHPAQPSEHDRSQAWPVYSYLIFSVIKGKGITAKAWEFNESTQQFEEEELDIIDGEVGAA